MTTVWIHKPNGSTELGFSRFSIHFFASISSQSNKRIMGMLWISGSKSAQTLCLVILELYFSSVQSLEQVAISPFGKGLRESFHYLLTYYSVAESFMVDTQLCFQSMGSRPENQFSNSERNCGFVSGSLPSTSYASILDYFWLQMLISHSSWLPVYSALRDTMLY